MIAFLRGKVQHINEDSVIVETSGVGYRVFAPASLLGQLPGKGSEVVLYTHMHVREDAISLFGFDSAEALMVFNQLINVSGVGPRGAMGLLSSYTPSVLTDAVASENIALLTRAPGIGKKIAQRIIIELKDKFGALAPMPAARYQAARGGVAADGIEALVGLGYSQQDAVEAVKRAMAELGESPNLQDVIRISLRGLGKGK